RSTPATGLFPPTWDMRTTDSPPGASRMTSRSSGEGWVSPRRVTSTSATHRTAVRMADVVDAPGPISIGSVFTGSQALSTTATKPTATATARRRGTGRVRDVVPPLVRTLPEPRRRAPARTYRPGAADLGP